MRASLNPEHLAELLAALDSRFVVQFANGAIRVLGRDLGGQAVSAILPDQGDGVLRIVYDPNQPNALCHTAAMLQEWYESYQEPVAFPDGSVEFVPQPCPRASTDDVDLVAT